MATRYGRRAADDTFEYHDSKESLREAEDREALDGISFVFGLIGLIAGSLIAYAMLLKFGTQWPKWLRFGVVIASGGSLAYVLAKLSHILWVTIWICIFLATAWGLVSLLWKAV